MKKSKIQIKFRNNHIKEYEVLFKVKAFDSEYIVYTLDEKKGDYIICYAGKLNDKEISDITTDEEKEMIQIIIENLNKGV
jgi:hypothetical protein